MNTYRTLQEKFHNKLSTISSLQEVYKYPKQDFGGYPAAVLVPIEGDGDYETNQEDFRDYKFELHLYYDYANVGQETALQNLMDATDDVMDNLSGDKMLASISMPTGKMLIGVNPVWSGWEELNDKSLIHATIQITAMVSVDNS